MNHNDAEALSATEKAQRTAYRKSLPKSVSTVAKGTGWRCSQGVLFREIDDWFVYAELSVNRLRRETRMWVAVKPMQIDPIFWSIVDLEKNNLKPLSFRVFGAWTCKPPNFLDIEIAEDNPDQLAQNMARSLLSQADSCLPSIREFTAENLVRLCRKSVRPENFIPTEATTLISLGKHGEARNLCKTAIAEGHSGSFMLGRRFFPQMTLDWLDANC